jgi:hypothetical protein
VSKKETAILTRKTPTKYRAKTGWEYTTEQFEVSVMARSSGYAMVRRKGCITFVVSTKDLAALEPHGEGAAK